MWNKLKKGVSKIMECGKNKTELMVDVAINSFNNDKNRKIIGLTICLFGLGLFLSGYLK